MIIGCIEVKDTPMREEDHPMKEGIPNRDMRPPRRGGSQDNERTSNRYGGHSSGEGSPEGGGPPDGGRPPDDGGPPDRNRGPPRCPNGRGLPDLEDLLDHQGQ